MSIAVSQNWQYYLKMCGHLWLPLHHDDQCEIRQTCIWYCSFFICRLLSFVFGFFFKRTLFYTWLFSCTLVWLNIRVYCHRNYHFMSAYLSKVWMLTFCLLEIEPNAWRRAGVVVRKKYVFCVKLSIDILVWNLHLENGNCMLLLFCLFIFHSFHSIH